MHEFYWKEATDHEIDLFNAISILFWKKEKLIYHMFDLSAPTLASSPDEIKFESGIFSKSEQLLIRIALDIWDGCGGINFNELYQELDDKNFQKILYLLLHLKNKRSGNIP